MCTLATNAASTSALSDPRRSLAQAMLDGDITLIGSGMIRDVYLVEHEGQKLVLKVLREDYELIASKSWIEDIHRWEAAALDAVSVFLLLRSVQEPTREEGHHSFSFTETWRVNTRRGRHIAYGVVTCTPRALSLLFACVLRTSIGM